MSVVSAPQQLDCRKKRLSKTSRKSSVALVGDQSVQPAESTDQAQHSSESLLDGCSSLIAEEHVLRSLNCTTEDLQKKTKEGIEALFRTNEDVQLLGQDMGRSRVIYPFGRNAKRCLALCSFVFVVLIAKRLRSPHRRDADLVPLQSFLRLDRGPYSSFVSK